MSCLSAESGLNTQKEKRHKSAFAYIAPDYKQRHLAAAIRKTDRRVLGLIVVGYLFCMLDRANIGYARVANSPDYTLDRTIGLEQVQGATLVSIFFATYVAFELPSNMVMKTLSHPGRWLAFLCTAWGAVTLAMGLANSYPALLALRLLLGVFESGYFPGGLFFLTMWYPASYMTLRMALFFCSSMLAGIVGGVASSAISTSLHLTLGLEGWRWIFICEGCATVVFGGFLLFTLPSLPSTSAFLKDEEKSALQDAIGLPSSAATTSDSPIDRSAIWAVLTRPSTYVFCIVIFCMLTSIFPSILLEMGFTHSKAQLLSSPPFLVGLVSIVTCGHLVDRYDCRFSVQAISLLLQVVGFSGMMFFESTWIKYAFSFAACVGINTVIPPTLSWLSSTAKGSSTAAGFLIGTVISFSNLGGLSTGYLYPKANAPDHFLGNGTNAIFGVVAFGGCVLLRYLLARNQ